MTPPLETSLAYKYFVAYRLYDGQRFDEVVIPYHPKHSFQKKIKSALKAESKVQALLALFCLGIVALSMSIHALPLPVFVLIAAAGAAWCAMEMYEGMSPTHFGLSAKGLRLYWIRWFGDNSSEHTAWNKISHVRIRHSKELGIASERWIEFIGDRGQSAFSLRLDGIVTGEQRKRLHTALKQHLSAAQLEPELHDLLNPIKVDGYTQLWLEVLSTSPTRIRSDSLSPHSVIANNRYEVLKQIGSGGQGTAYLCRSRPGAISPNSAPQDVVLKEFVLPYQGGLAVSKRALEKIEHEANLLKQLAHPQIVRMLDLFVEDQRAYLVLEHIKGESLRQIVDQRGRYAEEQVIELGMQMCEILLHLHMQNPAVVHRDFTPENLIMTMDGRLRLIDFNVALIMNANAARTVVGKHSYIPPEQFRGKATPQSDIYALGASLFFLLTGSEPQAIAAAHPRQLVPQVSPALDGAVAQATAPDLDVRFASAKELQEALAKLQKQAIAGA